MTVHYSGFFMNRLLGKVMLITEAHSRIGSTTAKSAAEEGAIIVCTGKQLDKLSPLISAVTQTVGIISAYQHDVSSRVSWKNVISDVIASYGKIDILVNTAGISSPKMSLELSLDDCKKIQGIDINSFVYGLNEVIPSMIKNGGGSIINVSTVEGLVDLPTSSPYAAVQDVIRSLSLDVAFEYANHNIRVNSICPGIIDTPIIETTFPKIRPDYKKSIQFPYLGKPEDIVNGIIYLSCDESSFVTGAKLVIDGDRITN